MRQDAVYADPVHACEEISRSLLINTLRQKNICARCINVTALVVQSVRDLQHSHAQAQPVPVLIISKGPVNFHFVISGPAQITG